MAFLNRKFANSVFMRNEMLGAIQPPAAIHPPPISLPPPTHRYGMSVSLLSRQLHVLRIGQRAATVRASWLAPALRWGSGSAMPVVAPVPLIATSFLMQQNYFDTPSRTFSVHSNIQEQQSSLPVIDDDDGGPVTSSAAVAAATNLLQSMSIKELADMSTIPGWNLVHNPPRKNPRGALVGRVVSDKMQKTVNVAVDRYKIIPKYRKRWRFTKKFMAHDEHEVCNMGDLVMIVPCQKISRHKHFMVREIIRPKGLL